jgi:hypothetical protein
MQTHRALINIKRITWSIVLERNIPTESRRLLTKSRCRLLRVEGCHVVRASNPHDRNLSFLAQLLSITYYLLFAFYFFRKIFLLYEGRPLRSIILIFGRVL